MLPTDVTGTLEVHTTQENMEYKQGSDAHIKKIKTNMTSNWTAADATYSKTYSNPTEIEQRKNNLVATGKGKSAFECFQECFDESVRYAKQKNNHGFNLSNECINKFLDILLFTGYHALPQEQLYWNGDENFDVWCVRQCMSRNRYLEIKGHLHPSIVHQCSGCIIGQCPRHLLPR